MAESPKAPTIAESDVVVGSEIARGSMGAVLSGTYNGTEVAFKSLHALMNPEMYNTHEGSEAKEHQLAELRKEADMLTKLRHPNILLYLGLVMEDSGLPKYLVTERATTSLESWLRSRGTVSPMELGQIMTHVLQGLANIHGGVNGGPPIVHRDLKAANILLFYSKDSPGPGTAKIADVGLARHVESRMTTSGTLCYMAPEVMSGHFDAKVDVYSFGVMFAEIVLARLRVVDAEPPAAVALDMENRLEVVSRAVDRLRRPWPEVAELLELCTLADPAKRPSSMDALQALMLAVDKPPGDPAREGLAGGGQTKSRIAALADTVRRYEADMKDKDDRIARLEGVKADNLRLLREKKGLEDMVEKLENKVSQLEEFKTNAEVEAETRKQAEREAFGIQLEDAQSAATAQLMAAHAAHSAEVADLRTKLEEAAAKANAHVTEVQATHAEALASMDANLKDLSQQLSRERAAVDRLENEKASAMKLCTDAEEARAAAEAAKSEAEAAKFTLQLNLRAARGEIETQAGYVEQHQQAHKETMGKLAALAVEHDAMKSKFEPLTESLKHETERYSKLLIDYKALTQHQFALRGAGAGKSGEALANEEKVGVPVSEATDSLDKHRKRLLEIAQNDARAVETEGAQDWNRRDVAMLLLTAKDIRDGPYSVEIQTAVCTTLRWLSRLPDKRDFMVVEGALSCLAEAMYRNSTSIELQVQACSAVANFALDPHNVKVVLSSSVGTLGMSQLVLRNLQHPNIGVRVAAVNTLHYMVQEGTPESHIMDWTVEVIKTWRSKPVGVNPHVEAPIEEIVGKVDPALALATLRFLGDMAPQRLYLESVPTLAVPCLKVFLENYDIQVATWNLLNSLCGVDNPSRHTLLSSLNLMMNATISMKRWRDDAILQEMACLVVAKLAVGGASVADSLMPFGNHVKDAMEAHPDHAGVQNSGCAALAYLAAIPKLKAMLVLIGAGELVQTALDSGLPGLAKNARRAIRNLSSDGVAK